MSKSQKLFSDVSDQIKDPKIDLSDDKVYFLEDKERIFKLIKLLGKGG